MLTNGFKNVEVTGDLVKSSFSRKAVLRVNWGRM